MTRTPQETFHELTDRVGKLAAGDSGQVEALAALYADTTDVSFPMTPAAPTLRSRAEVYAYFADVATQLAEDVTVLRPEGVRILETVDPEVVVAEFHYAGEGPQGGFTWPNVFVMRIREGQIVESRDYSGPRPASKIPVSDTHEAFLSLIDGVRKLVAGDRSQVDRLAALYAEQAHVVYWGAPDKPLRGREELRVHFAKVPERFAAPRFRGFRAENVRIHDTTDPEVIVSEFAYVSDGDGVGDVDGPPLNQRCCFVLRIRGGQILQTHDYVLNPM